MSDLRRAVQEEIDAHHASTVPPFAAIQRRKQARDRRHVVAGAALLSAIIAGTILLPDRASDLAVHADTSRFTRTPEVGVTPTSSSAPSDAASQEPTTSAGAAAPPPVLPDRVVLSSKTALVVDGVRNSDPRTLERYEPATEGPPHFLSRVELSPDGSVVYADVCCEPASGRTQPISLDDPATKHQPIDAMSPAVSPDGLMLAALSLDMLALYDVAAGHRLTRTVEPGDAGHVREGLAWARDGRLLALTEAPVGASGLDAQRVMWRIRLLDPRTATSLDDGQVLAAPDGQTYVAPAFRRDGMLVVARQDADPDSAGRAAGVVLDPEDGRVVAEFALDGRVVAQDYDRSGTYLLTTYSNGRVAWKGAGSSGVLRRSGPAIAASW